MLQIQRRMQDLRARRRRRVQHTGKRLLCSALRQHRILKGQPTRIGEQQTLLQNKRGPRQHRRIAHVRRSIREHPRHLRNVLQRLAHRLQHVVGKAHHCLTLQHCIPCRTVLVGSDVPVVLGDVLCHTLRLGVLPVLQVHFLILQRVGQLMRHNWLLLVHRHPVQ